MKVIRLLLLLLASIIFISCGTKKEVPTVKLGHAPHDHHAPLYIAAAMGDYFKKNGGVYLKEITYKTDYQLYRDGELLANIKIDSSTGGINLIRKLDEKILDVSFGGVPAMIEMIDKGSRIKIIAPVNADGDALIVDKNMPVSNWKEFVDYIKESKKPVRIGYKVSTSVQNLIFESALNNEGISFSRELNAENVDVVVVNLHGPNNLLPALESHVIDGFVVMQPFPAMAEYSTNGKIISQLRDLPPSGDWNDHPCCALASGEDFIKKHEDIVEALIELFGKAAEYIGEHPHESAAITSKWLGTSVDVEALSLPTIRYKEEYNKEWNSGVDFWVSSLIKSGEITGEVKKAYESSTLDKLIYDKTPYDSVRKRMNKDVDK